MSVHQYPSMNSSLSPNGTQHLSFFERCSIYPLGPLLWSCFCLICFLFGFPVTAKVLWEIYQGRKQKATNDFFLFNIAVMNLSFIVFMPFIALNYMVWRSLSFEWFINYLNNAAMSGKPLFLTCICGDCYFAVVHPIAYRSSRENSIGRKAIAVIIWLYTVWFGLLMSCVNWKFTFPLGAISMFIALPVITFCDISVLLTIHKADSSGGSYSHPQKKRFIQTVTSTFILAFFAYLPPIIVFPLIDVVQTLTEENRCNLLYFVMCCPIVGSMFMPFLYLYNVKKSFSKEWWRKLLTGLYSN